ncbi:PAQR family membrane homeostasis protein TrhA [Ornithinimicrobium sediminis]|uniref:PAQR family membrane homeostasis protein TrhA n=1 Tax=Ornithinimicrobium sediminis TaxID=2904603 RepID=UPI001E4225F2|nr:hemolysin III family protein [Ornithinimicrobium sediminis]MCE0485622.1 hemolysin III family protein [Ornithinimicrobium sediminis]
MTGTPETGRTSGVAEKAHELGDELSQTVHDVASAVKPRLRGWLHLGMVPLSLAAAVVLVVLAPTTPGRLSAAVFGTTAVMLFATSATYHRGRWSDRTNALLKRMDHANIFLIIAGSYTPFAVMLLPDAQRSTLLWIVWTGAVAGVLFRVFWVGAPRWLYTPVYVALGWVAVFYLVDFYRAGGLAVVVLLAAGGLLYTLGAVVYALKRPNPSALWFGFHEVFHAFTVAAFTVHYVAVSLVVYGATPAGV